MAHDPISVSPRQSRLSLFLGLLAGLLLFGRPAAGSPQAAAVPALDHVIVIMMENQSYDGVRTLPYITSLIATQSSFSASYAITHPSQPNYLAIWSGSLKGTSNDNCPAPG